MVWEDKQNTVMVTLSAEVDGNAAGLQVNVGGAVVTSTAFVYRSSQVSLCVSVDVCDPCVLLT